MIWSLTVISNIPIVGSDMSVMTSMDVYTSTRYRGSREGLVECLLTAHTGNKIPRTMWVSVRIGCSYGVDSGNSCNLINYKCSAFNSTG